jgi:hypothetical protein
LRGHGTNTDGTTSGAGAFLSAQTDDFKSHRHRMATGNATYTSSGNTSSFFGLYNPPAYRDMGDAANNGLNYLENTGGTETRPKNIAVNYIIKAKAVSLSTSNISEIVASLNTFTPATVTTSGVKGLVPAPAAGDNNAFLRGNGTWRKFIGGTVVIGNVGAATIGTITGDITSASVISNSDDGYTIIQVNFANMGSDPIVNVMQESIGSNWIADNDTSRIMIRNRTPTSVQIGLFETANVVQNIRLHVTILVSS